MIDEPGHRVIESSPARALPVRPAFLLVSALVLLLCGCGGTDARAADEPTPTRSPTTVATRPPTTVTPTPTPASPFEDRAPVKALRAWAVGEARAVNARDRSLSQVAAVTTSHGLDQTRTFAADDIAHGYLLPGPHPFTPVSVQLSGRVAKVNSCLLLRGWSLRPRTKAPVRKREVVAAVFEMHKVGSAWKLDRYYAGSADCAGVRLQEVRW